MLVLCFANISSQFKATDTEEEIVSHLTEAFLLNHWVMYICCACLHYTFIQSFSGIFVGILYFKTLNVKKSITLHDAYSD